MKNSALLLALPLCSLTALGCGGESDDPYGTSTGTTSGTTTGTDSGTSTGTTTGTDSGTSTGTTTGTSTGTITGELDPGGHPDEAHVAVDNCNEAPAATFSPVSLADAYGKATIPMDGGKSYNLATNWWSEYSGQTVSSVGNNFSISGDAGGANRNEGAPAGFPTLFLGSYNGQSSTGSNLPKQVSQLTSVPTVFRTNGTSFAQDYYNATYDVWLTSSASGVPNETYNPGAGGAYLMVWTFKPGQKRPRGPENAQHTGRKVANVSGTWDVWVDDTDPPCISYVATVPVDDLGFDLKDFIDDSVIHGYGITESMYLSIIFAGFEVWDEGDGLETQEFCASVE